VRVPETTRGILEKETRALHFRNRNILFRIVIYYQLYSFFVVVVFWRDRRYETKDEAVTYIQNDDFNVAYKTIRRHDLTNYKIRILLVELLRLVSTTGCSETSVRNY